ncbi:hypothetical protein [Vibrio variabilis]|uniref:hypothetical protein n=1 Tax=Vibrio variabilis TaxID=990271 RepID=UPI001EFA1304|nr:hypothetical protein [Vibrio variabilis]
MVGENSKRAFPLTDREVEKGSVTKQSLGIACALEPNRSIPSRGVAFSARDPHNPIEMQNEQIHLNLVHQSFNQMSVVQMSNDDVLQSDSPDDILHSSASSSAVLALNCVKAASFLTTKIISLNENTLVTKANNSCCKQNLSEVCNINLPFIHLLKTSYGNHYEKLN